MGSQLFVWESQSLFAKGKCARPLWFGCHLRADCCFWSSTQTVFTGVSRVVPEYESSRMMIFPRCAPGRGLWLSDIVSLWRFNPVFYVRNVEETLSARWRILRSWEKFAAFSVKTYIPFLKYVCMFVLSFRNCWVLRGPYTKEKCACNQLADGCVHMCVCSLVDVED